MKILLINPIIHEHKSVFTDVKYPPIGLLQVASHYRKIYSQRANSRNTKIKVIDGQVSSEAIIYREFQKLEPDIVGFNVMIGQPLKTAHEMTRIMKAVSPKTKIIWGGAIARINPYLVPPIAEIDPNYYDSQPAWDLLSQPEKYEHAIYTSRGCPWKCSFCYHRIDDKIRFEADVTVVSQMDYLSRNFGWKYFKIMDDNFFTSTPRAIKIMKSMKKKGFKIKQAHSHANSFTQELIDFLDREYVHSIGISIEHGDQKIVDSLGKKLNIQKTLRVIEQLGNKQIKTIHNFIFGLPYNTNDQQNFQRMKQIKALNPLARGVGFVYAPMPETPLGKQIEAQYGDYPKTYKFWEDFNMAVINKKYNKWLTEAQIKETQRMADAFNKEFNE